mgnify:CR=1 FL=1
MLQGKHIVLGISGGIAAYKTPELVRLLTKQGAQVRVCCTQNALQFVTVTTLQTLSNYPVYTDVFAPHRAHETEHISLPDWADLMVVAPATANSIGKFANGIADDALSTTFLAMLRPTLVVPAMNSNMLSHPATEANLLRLNSFEHVTVMESAEGWLACGATGKGRMPEPEQIVEQIERLLAPKPLQGKRVLITAGPTQEKIDPVRFISNYSSGKMGYALAKQCQLLGADVTLVSGPTNLTFSGRTISVTTAEQMYRAATENFTTADLTILCAAVADFRPLCQATEKIKRGQDNMSIVFCPNKDIAKELGSRKVKGQVLVGFALETTNEKENALNKLSKKNLDAIVLNSLQDAGAGFQTDTNKVSIFFADGKQTELPLQTKQATAADIINTILPLL